jgi:hypothetical protein
MNLLEFWHTRINISVWSSTAVDAEVPRGLIKPLGTSRATLSTLHTEDPQILDADVQNLVATTTWRLNLCTSVIHCRCLLPYCADVGNCLCFIREVCSFLNHQWNSAGYTAVTSIIVQCPFYMEPTSALRRHVQSRFNFFYIRASCVLLQMVGCHIPSWETPPARGLMCIKRGCVTEGDIVMVATVYCVSSGRQWKLWSVYPSPPPPNPFVIYAVFLLSA